ncbi:MAG TPA: hypothetical protein PLN92_02525 [Thermotogota bacterium]|nr:hypothetical protein [Thermotogota bacterium]
MGSIKNTISKQYRKLTPFFVKRKNQYKTGISIMITVKDESEWIYETLKTATYVADEIVISSFSNKKNDTSRKEINRFLKNYHQTVPIRLFDISFSGSEDLHKRYEKLDANNFCLQRNLALFNCTFSVVYSWDGDHVGNESEMKKIKKLILQKELENKKCYWFAYSPVINIYGDSEHTNKLEPKNIEPKIFSNSKYLRYQTESLINKASKGIPHIRIPFYYKRFDFDFNGLFHPSNLKPIENVVRRIYWTPWRKEIYVNNQNISLDEYISCKKGEERDITFYRNFFQGRIAPKLEKYNNRFGEVPEIIKASKYKIVYKNGQPYSRNDIEELDN